MSRHWILIACMLGQAGPPPARWCYERSEQERARYGLDALIEDPRLVAEASAHASRIARGWRDPRFHSRHSFTASGHEVVAVTGTSDPVSNWLSLPSVGHRECVLGRRWRRCGFGRARGADGRNYWVGLYAE